MVVWKCVSLPQLFGARFRGRHEERKTALRECKTTSSRLFKSPYKIFLTSWNNVLGISNIFHYHTITLEKKRIRRHANQKISTKTRLLLKNKQVQNVFSSDIPLNCHFDKKTLFFIKSQNRQKLSKNDGKTFQRSPRRYIFINWSNYLHMIIFFSKKNEKV